MVLIDMDKPKSCDSCPIVDADDSCPLRPESKKESIWKQYGQCPLKEVQG